MNTLSQDSWCPYEESNMGLSACEARVLTTEPKHSMHWVSNEVAIYEFRGVNSAHERTRITIFKPNVDLDI